MDIWGNRLFYPFANAACVNFLLKICRVNSVSFCNLLFWISPFFFGSILLYGWSGLWYSRIPEGERKNDNMLWGFWSSCMAHSRFPIVYFDWHLNPLSGNLAQWLSFRHCSQKTWVFRHWLKWWLLGIEFRRIKIAGVVTEDCVQRLVELWTFLNAKKMTGYTDH